MLAGLHSHDKLTLMKPPPSETGNKQNKCVELFGETYLQSSHYSKGKSV